MYDGPSYAQDDEQSAPDEDVGAGSGLAAGWAARDVEILAELAEIGLEMARAAKRRALMEMERIEAAASGDEASAVAAGPAMRDPEAGFVRIARAVRQTLALKARALNAAASQGGASGGGAKPYSPDDLPPATPEEQEKLYRRFAYLVRRGSVEQIVEEAIAAERGDQERTEYLLDAMHERLNDDDIYIDERPVGEIVVQVCRDLGLPPDWSQKWLARRTDQDGDGDDPANDPGSGPEPPYVFKPVGRLWPPRGTG